MNPQKSPVILPFENLEFKAKNTVQRKMFMYFENFRSERVAWTYIYYQT